MYKQFNKNNRVELAVLLRAGLSYRFCARQLGFNHSTVIREINKNKDKDGIYRGLYAHKKYLERRKKSKQKYRKIENDINLRNHIKKRLKKKDSPEQISGRINKIIDKEEIQNVSRDTIYTWIFDENPKLKKYLRRIGKKGKYRRRKGTKIREKQREEKKIKRIDTRPEVVEKRERVGDFEGDTIIGCNKTKRLLTNVDRMSGYGMIDKINTVSLENLQNTLKKRFRKIPKSKRYTYTYDNGTEIGKEDRDLEKKIGMDIYRAYPYHSWERGSSENYNGLVRDFFPKGTDFANISIDEIRRVERNLNNRPRKRLGYLTPHEVFVLGKRCGAVQVRM